MWLTSRYCIHGTPAGTNTHCLIYKNKGSFCQKSQFFQFFENCQNTDIQCLSIIGPPCEKLKCQFLYIFQVQVNFSSYFWSAIQIVANFSIVRYISLICLFLLFILEKYQMHPADTRFKIKDMLGLINQHLVFGFNLVNPHLLL